MQPNVSHEESDQSPVKGLDARKLLYDLSIGLDYSPLNSHLSEWLRVIYCGDYETSPKHWAIDACLKNVISVHFF